jgi:hypothetical protein
MNNSWTNFFFTFPSHAFGIWNANVALYVHLHGHVFSEEETACWGKPAVAGMNNAFALLGATIPNGRFTRETK